jgi:hypothetical protein
LATELLALARAKTPFGTRPLSRPPVDIHALLTGGHLFPGNNPLPQLDSAI